MWKMATEYQLIYGLYQSIQHCPFAGSANIPSLLAKCPKFAALKKYLRLQ